MIKKFIFSSALILSLTTHHAVCMDKDDDESLDAPTISEKLAALNEEREKESEYNAKLIKRGYGTSFIYEDNSSLIGRGNRTDYKDDFEQSDNRLSEIWAKRQKLKALLKKVEGQAS